jgi:hypothetical protein
MRISRGSLPIDADNTRDCHDAVSIADFAGDPRDVTRPQ